MVYKLRSTLIGHEADVRAVAPAVFPTGGVLTASRDQTCRLWSPGDKCFTQSQIFCGHTRYVAAVCAMPPSEAYPQGLVITGGHDNVILCFECNSVEPIWKLEGHSGTVCSLDAGKFGTILSGSWDKTARVWINGKAVMTFSDHEAAVWAVKMLPDRGLMLTGSADKTIKLWKAGKCERTFTGHKDCVRCLAIVSSEEFLSCSNDGHIRRWKFSGDCVQIYEGHSNFIYSIAVMPDSNDVFVSSGEDRTVKVWKEGSCDQTIMMPCQSVWSVAFLDNGDIVAGGSDSTTRVFTCDEALKASDVEIKEFEEFVSNHAIPAAANLDLGEIKTDQLPGPEALLRPGTKKDQTKLIKRNGIVEAHQWDSTEGQWKKVGEVTGAAGAEGGKRATGKEEFEGKKYDYVFNVDIEEGKPPLKLPFNVTDDPWLAAQKFLERNDLSQLFLDQVANFVIKNTEGITLGSAPSTLSDPFTGQGRYVPGAGSVNVNAGSSDPFTGTGRYIPSNSSNVGITSSDGLHGNAGEVENDSLQYIPEKSFLKFISGKSNLIMSKLTEFNPQVSDSAQFSENELETLSNTIDIILKDPAKLQSGTLECIAKLLSKLTNWPEEKLLPVLDILRLLVLNENICLHIYDSKHCDMFIENLLTIVKKLQPVPNILMIFRLFANSFLHPHGGLVVYDQRKAILDCCENLYSLNHKNLSIALSSVMVNFSVYCAKKEPEFESRVLLCSYFSRFLGIKMEEEALFRLLVALGTLLYMNAPVVEYAKSLGMDTLINNIMGTLSTSKVKDCALQISKQFSM